MMALHEPEQRFLGSILVDPAALEEGRRLLGALGAQAFESVRCRAVWRAFCALADAGQELSLEVAAAWLDREHRALCADGEGEGWRVWLWKHCYETSTSGAMVTPTGKLLRGRAITRELRRLAADVPELVAGVVEQLPDEAEAVLASVQARLAEIAFRAAGAHGAMFGELARSVVSDLDSEAPTEGYPSGIGPLDRLIHRLAPGRLYVLGARPGHGKSTVGSQIARNVAQQDGSVIFFSLEMTAEEVAQMHLAAMALVDSDLIQRRVLNPSQRADVRQAARRWGDIQLDIHDRATLTLAGLRSHVLRRAQEWGQTPDLVVVDYLQLMSVPNAGGRARHELVGELSRGLKELALEHRTAVLALAQLGRGAAESPVPQLHHLRESGSIEQDANVVALQAMDEDARELWVYVHKNRHGAPGKFRMAYDAPNRRLLPWGGTSEVVEL